MDLQQLKYFSSLARIEHMSRAAEELHISQPSLSISIRRLEAELGVPLFDRRGRNIRLNEYGEAFLARVIPVLELLELGQQELRELKALKGNHLEIISPSLFIFPGLMDKVLAYNPNITISHTDFYSPAKVAQMISKGNIDFCLTTTPIQDGSLMSEIIRYEQMVLIVSKNHPLAAQPKTRLANCKKQYFATFNGNKLQRYNFERLCSQVGLVPQISFEGNTVREILMAVRSSPYIALVTKQALEYYSTENIVTLEVEDVPEEPMRIYWSKASDKPASKAVRQIIIDYFHREQESASSLPGSKK